MGLWWNSPEEFRVAAQFASGGVLFYTASFAALETGVMLVVLAWKVKEYFDNKQLDKGAAMWREAERQSQTTKESVDDAYERLKAEGWRPAKS